MVSALTSTSPACGRGVGTCTYSSTEGSPVRESRIAFMACLLGRDRHAVAQRRHDVPLEQVERAQRFGERQIAERKAANQIICAGLGKLRAQGVAHLLRRADHG